MLKDQRHITIAIDQIASHLTEYLLLILESVYICILCTTVEIYAWAF